MRTHRMEADTSRLLHLLIFCILTCFQTTLTSAGLSGVKMPAPRAHCQSEFFTAQCGEHEVIVMEQAQYGRMHINNCVKEDFGYLGCSRDVLEYMDTWCSGRRSCRVKVLDEAFPGLQPCHGDLKSFLESSYRCVKVARPHRSSCRKNHNLTLSGSSGFLASLVADETGCGTADSPWIIAAQPGQKVVIMLQDFAVRINGTKHVPGTEETNCRVYATVRERSSSQSETICGGRERLSRVYTSVTNRIELRMLNSKTSPKATYFLFYYEVTGCPKLKAPDNGWLQMSGPDTAVLGCDHSDRSWRVACNETQWRGTLGNCSTATQEPIQGAMDFGIVNLSFEASILVVIVMAITIGLVVLAMGLFCMRKYSNQRPRRGEPRHVMAEYSGDVLVQPCIHHKAMHDLQVSMHPEGIVTSAKDVVYRDDDYGANVRLLAQLSESPYDRENCANQTRDPRPLSAPPYEDTATGTKYCMSTFDPYSPADSGINTDYCLQCHPHYIEASDLVQPCSGTRLVSFVQNDERPHQNVASNQPVQNDLSRRNDSPKPSVAKERTIKEQDTHPIEIS